MALLAGSSIQPWLTFDGTLPVIQPCRFVNSSNEYVDIGVYPITNCSNVCNDSISLFEPTNSDTLVTCGLWSTLVSSLTYDGLGNALLPPNDTKSLTLLKPFNAVGLDLDDIPYTLSYADEISDCLVEIYSDVKQFSFSDDGTIPANCSRNDIFPFGTNIGSAGWASTVSSLRTCMNYSTYLPSPPFPLLDQVGSLETWFGNVQFSEMFQGSIPSLQQTVLTANSSMQPRDSQSGSCWHWSRFCLLKARQHQYGTDSHRPGLFFLRHTVRYRCFRPGCSNNIRIIVSEAGGPGP